MRQRCNNPRNPRWKDYGGRGITISEHWNSFWAFVEDMAPRPEGTQIDRRNNDMGYSKENCRWVTSAVNNRNKRACKVHCDSGTGVKNICQYRKGYRVMLWLNGANHFLGDRPTLEEAQALLALGKEKGPEEAKRAFFLRPPRAVSRKSKTGIKGVTPGNGGFVVNLNGKYHGTRRTLQEAIVLKESILAEVAC
jgi:hypothetical protein